MSWTSYIIVGFIIASLFFVAAAYALFWAQKNGHLTNFEEGAKTIFDEEEPLGQSTDSFPPKKKRPTRSA